MNNSINARLRIRDLAVDIPDVVCISANIERWKEVSFIMTAEDFGRALTQGMVVNVKIELRNLELREKI